ncbi:hypothetical protein EDC04DRAFT_2661342, partial [Pisolithus marmoratus]
MSATVNVNVIKMSDKQPNTLGDQARLSVGLQLLDKLGYPGLQGVGPYGNDLEEIYDRQAGAAVRALDTIAIMLTTGAPGEVFATAFDKHQGFTLVLAKSTPVTSADEQAVRWLVKAITASTTEDAKDILPFLFSRCRTNIEKRITRMHKVMTAFSSELEEILKGYKPSLIVEEEFPASDRYRKWKYSGGKPSALQIIHDVLADIMTRAQVFNPGNASLSVELYVELAMMATTLQKSRLLRWLRDPANWHLRRWSPQVEKLDRCLTKAFQYYHGVNELIKYAKRYFPDDINHLWVNASAGTAETIVELDNNYLQVISRALSRPLQDEQKAALHEKFPDLEERWRNSHLLETRVHPEISIILHLSSTPLNPSDLRRQRPMGLSKRACLCCTMWITAYNSLFHPEWLMSRTDGKADATWALPGCSYAHAVVNDNGQSLADAAVWRAVTKRLARILQSLFPAMPESESVLQRRVREASEMAAAHALTVCFGEKQGLMKRITKQFKR